MTAELRILIDARGGGSGHAHRGARLANAWRRAGHHVSVCVSPGSDRHLPPDPQRFHADAPHDPSALPSADLLLVDTFAEGFFGAWPQRSLARYPRRVLLARHRVDPPSDDVYARYQRIWTPYSADTDEWGAPPPHAQPIGLLARELPCRTPLERATLTVFDPGARLDARVRRAIAHVAAAQRRPLRWLRVLKGQLDAAKLLVIGAGYHTVYELLRAGFDVRFVPLKRRHDDQFARARRFGVALESLAALAEWLRHTCAPRPLAAHHFATEHTLEALL